MGNQNATAIQQDGNVNDQDSEKLAQENIVPNINNQEKQLTTSEFQVKEESNHPKEIDEPECIAAFENEENTGNEEMQAITYEAQDQASVHNEGDSDDSEPVVVSTDPTPSNDTSIIENGCIHDEQTFTDNQTCENHFLSESELSDIEEHDVYEAHESADVLFNEDHKWSTEDSFNHEPNVNYIAQVHQAINMTEEKPSDQSVATSLTVCSEISMNEQHYETDVKCAPQPVFVEVDLNPTEKGSESDQDHAETSQLLKVVQEYSIGDSNANAEETTMPVADTHDSIRVPQLTSVQNDMSEVDGEQTIMMETTITHKLHDQMEDIKDVKENFTSLPNSKPDIMNADTKSVLSQPVASNGSHDIEELSEKNLNGNAKSGQDKIRCLVITQETEPAKPVLEGFIFADHLRDGEVMLDSLKCDLQIEKCPSFNFDIKNDSRPEESNHTLLLYQNKPPMRSLSSPGNVFLNILSEKCDGNGRDFSETHVKEKTVMLERTDSVISKTPLSKTEEDKHQRDETTQNGNLKGEMLQLAKTRQKHKTRPYFFSSCVCCAGVDQLNADF